MRQIADNPKETVFKGTFEEVNRFFNNKGWTDGLPVVPPTTERVEEFLKYTSLAPHTEIGILPQARLQATPWNIAVNGVMAGCRPQHMPLLIAAVEAIADPVYNLEQIGTTVGINPFLLISGPVVKQSGIEYGTGVVSCGPNPVIGRFLSLIMRNIAGFKPAFTQMGTWGYVPPFVLAEDEDALYAMGWQPYHVEHGFGKDTSTVMALGSYSWGFQEEPQGTNVEASVLPALSRELSIRVHPRFSLDFGDRSVACVLITPPVAEDIALAGYTKKSLAEWLWKNTRISVRELDVLNQYFRGYGPTVHSKVVAGELPAWFDVGPDETVPIMVSPDLINILVCGDRTRNKVMVLWETYLNPSTREIKLPQNLK
jgi:hypothetical protein